jgi:hypothetical protein
MALPRPEVTTDSQPEPSFLFFRISAHAPSVGVLIGQCFAIYDSQFMIRSLRDCEPYRLCLGISSRRRRYRDGVIARRGAAHRGLRLATAASGDKQLQAKQSAQDQDPKHPPPLTISACTQESDPGNDEPDSVEMSREDARSRRDDRAGSRMDG